MENTYDVAMEMIANEATELPQEARLPQGFKLLKHATPTGNSYMAALYGDRELELFIKGRADMMTFKYEVDGAYSYGILYSRTWKGMRAYMLDATGIDICVKVRPIDANRCEIKEVYPYRGATTFINPEAVDRFTGELKSDYAGGMYKTIQHQMLESEGTCFLDVKGPQNSYERGIYAMGASIQWGGYRTLRVAQQLARFVELEQAGRIMPVINGMHCLELVGLMAQLGRQPRAIFVKIAAGDTTYQDAPLTSLVRLHNTQPLVKGDMALDAWLRIQREHKEECLAGTVGVRVYFAKESAV